MRTNHSGYDCCEGGNSAFGFAAESLKDREADQRWSSMERSATPPSKAFKWGACPRLFKLF
tara:strand:- start:44 stop:226 length:183 start_codon:yes stop_codon:yes gene_type:complete